MKLRLYALCEVTMALSYARAASPQTPAPAPTFPLSRAEVSETWRGRRCYGYGAEVKNNCAGVQSNITLFFSGNAKFEFRKK